MNRRRFLASAGALAAVSAVSEVALADTEATASNGLSILQGYTNATSTQLTVDVPRKQEVIYSLHDVETNRALSPVSVKPVTFGSSSTRVDKIHFKELQLGHRYKLTVTDKKTNKKIDERFLSAVDLEKENVRIGLMSCMDERLTEMSSIWNSAKAAKLDYCFFLGDAVYGDLLFLHGPSYLWSRYIQTRKKVPFYRWRDLVPVIAIWDDHDFGKNDEDGFYKYKDHAYQMFKTFFAQDPDGDSLINGYANSVYFGAFNQNFVFFDNRYYRGLPGEDGKVSFLGRDQINWMSKIVEARPNPTLVLQGSPFFGRFEKQGSYEHTAPDELLYFMDKVRSWNSPVVFGAGDLHYSELSVLGREVLGYETYELISSCMHSRMKGKFGDNPNLRLQGYLKENFMVLEKSGLRADANWKITCIGKNMVVPFEQNLAVG